ncbi:LysR family transcriptional regulator [Natronospirillum operosum]|uniref:LysR family transcriptional regulator n=1 Tax=Natronospirillum operosum TaxID=2759953 RepID=A0A4Z0WCD5_9GAMM|nr:LysR family transcriptional regulator [Natronospirillum operosum]TGG91463.1 LysR family transcriptional regulator [Natronospirillum operosum]
MSLPDLNLIRVFVVLYETGSVTQCARRLNVTQPSVSYALSRLRDQLDDRLFVRRHQAMTPTMTAHQIYPDLKAALQTLETHLNSRHHFDPAQCNMRFRLALTDLGEMVFLPTILNHLQSAAPDLELEVVPLQIEDVPEWLTAGQVNAVICSRPIELRSLERQPIARDRYVCMARADTFEEGPMTLETFSQRKQVVVSGASGHSLVEDILHQMNVQRKVALEVPHFSILPSLLMTSGFMSVLPIQIANQFAAGHDLAVRSLPFQVPDFHVSLYWHIHANRSPAQHWFCQAVLEAVRSMNIPEPEVLVSRLFGQIDKPTDSGAAR